MAELPQATNCGSYYPGHHVHWIQANKAEHEPGIVHRVEVLGFDGNAITVVVDGVHRRFLNHNAALIEQVAGQFGNRGVFIPRWMVLAIPGRSFGIAFDLDEERALGEEGGSHLFYLATEKSWRACVAPR